MAKKEGQIAVLTKINTESEESFEFTEGNSNFSFIMYFYLLII